jgi:hypothetical protein
MRTPARACPTAGTWLVNILMCVRLIFVISSISAYATHLAVVDRVHRILSCAGSQIVRTGVCLLQSRGIFFRIQSQNTLGSVSSCPPTLRRLLDKNRLIAAYIPTEYAAFSPDVVVPVCVCVCVCVCVRERERARARVSKRVVHFAFVHALVPATECKI